MEPPVIESGVQLFSRITSTSELAGINKKLFPSGPFSNQAIEIVGNGTNHLLIDFIIRCIGPTALNEEWKNLAAVFINTEHQINILKIIKALDVHLKALNLPSSKRKKVIEESLRNLTVVDCFDDNHFELALCGLEKSVQENDKSVALVVIDSFSSQYWIARSEHGTALTVDYYVKSKFVACQKAVKNLNVVLLFGRDSKNSPGVDYSLISEEDSLTVINYEKESQVKFQLKLEPCVSFM